MSNQAGQTSNAVLTRANLNSPVPLGGSGPIRTMPGQAIVFASEFRFEARADAFVRRLDGEISLSPPSSPGQFGPIRKLGLEPWFSG
jgi:hypothetical protein